MIEPRMFVRMLLKRLDEQKLAHTEHMKRGLKKKEYHHVCGRIAEVDDLHAHIMEIVKSGKEPDDDDDLLTKERSTHVRTKN